MIYKDKKGFREWVDTMMEEFEKGTRFHVKQVAQAQAEISYPVVGSRVETQKVCPYMQPCGVGNMAFLLLFNHGKTTIINMKHNKRGTSRFHQTAEEVKNGFLYDIRTGIACAWANYCKIEIPVVAVLPEDCVPGTVIHDVLKKEYIYISKDPTQNNHIIIKDKNGVIQSVPSDYGRYYL